MKDWEKKLGWLIGARLTDVNQCFLKAWFPFEGHMS